MPLSIQYFCLYLSLVASETSFTLTYAPLIPFPQRATSAYLPYWPATYTFLFFGGFFGLRHAAYRILVPQPGIKPGPLAVRVPSPNHWTARELRTPPPLFFSLTKAPPSGF